MPYPVIWIDSATGSDTLSSGAGPGDGVTSGSALNGSAASTDGTGLVVTLDGSPNLTNVLTDGTHVLRLTDATSNARNFAAIVAKDNTAKTVTVALAYAAGLTGKQWAIGGRLASWGSTTSRAISDRGATNIADMQAGWSIVLASGHAETVGAIVFARRAGTSTALCSFRAEPGAVSPPTLTISINAVILNFGASGNVYVDGLRFRCTNATRTSCVAISNVVGNFRVSNCLADDASNPVATLFAASGNATVENCRVVGSVAAAVIAATQVIGCEFVNCLYGYRDQSSTTYRPKIERNIITGCGTGISIELSASGTPASECRIRNNTIHANTGDGITITATSSNPSAFSLALIENNSITGNGGFGLKVDGTITTALLGDFGAIIRNNNFGTGGTANTSGATSSGISGAPLNSLSVDPQFANVGGDNFAVGTNLKGLGWPTANIGQGSTRSYVDVGAADRQEPSAVSSYSRGRVVNA